jgi:hypothetical protein
MPMPLSQRFQYQKKSWGFLKKVQRKKMFPPKSMTKLEDLTVQYKAKFEIVLWPLITGHVCPTQKIIPMLKNLDPDKLNGKHTGKEARATILENVA